LRKQKMRKLNKNLKIKSREFFVCKAR